MGYTLVEQYQILRFGGLPFTLIHMGNSVEERLALTPRERLFAAIPEHAPRIIQILGEAAKRGIPLVVVGSLGGALHGAASDCGDLDVIYDGETEREAFVVLLNEMGFVKNNPFLWYPRQVEGIEQPSITEGDFEDQIVHCVDTSYSENMVLGANPHSLIDIFQASYFAEMTNPDELTRGAVEMSMGGFSIKVVSLKHLQAICSGVREFNRKHPRLANNSRKAILRSEEFAELIDVIDSGKATIVNGIPAIAAPGGSLQELQ